MSTQYGAYFGSTHKLSILRVLTAPRRLRIPKRLLSYICFSVLIVVVVLTESCGNKEKLFAQKIKSDYFFTTLDGRKIVYDPVDSLLVMQFNEGVSNEQKHRIFNELDLRLLNISHTKGGRIQSIEEPTLVLGVRGKNSSATFYETVEKYKDIIQGALPAFTHEDSKEPSYLNPTTFGIVFHLDVPQDSTNGLLNRYRLVIPKNWAERHAFSFYILRFSHVRLSDYERLFQTIRCLSEEPAIYSAFPLYTTGGYALRHGPSPIRSKRNMTMTIMKNPVLRKIQGKLSELYWLWKTASPDVVRKLAERLLYPISGDSIEVVIRIDKIDRNEVESLLRYENVRSITTMYDAGQWWAVAANVSVPQIESLIENDDVLRIDLTTPVIEQPPFDLEKLPPPPGQQTSLKADSLEENLKNRRNKK